MMQRHSLATTNPRRRVRAGHCPRASRSRTLDVFTSGAEGRHSRRRHCACSAGPGIESTRATQSDAPAPPRWAGWLAGWPAARGADAAADEAADAAHALPATAAPGGCCCGAPAAPEPPAPRGGGRRGQRPRGGAGLGRGVAAGRRGRRGVRLPRVRGSVGGARLPLRLRAARGAGGAHRRVRGWWWSALERIMCRARRPSMRGLK